ncbi:MAG: hypothetical protein V4588_01800, partial [Pseudomonadota bacterium]
GRSKANSKANPSKLQPRHSREGGNPGKPQQSILLLCYIAKISHGLDPHLRVNDAPLIFLSPAGSAVTKY